jgi:hypothetical protein
MSTTINCPHCNSEVDVNASLSHQFEHKLQAERSIAKAQLEKEIALQRKNYKQHQKVLKAKEEAFEESVIQATKVKLLEEKSKIKIQLRREFDVENQASMQEMQRQLQEKSEQVKAFNLAKIEIEKLKREKDEVSSIAEAKAEAYLNSTLRQEKERLLVQAKEDKRLLMKEFEEANELKLKAKDEQLIQIKRELDNAQRKMEQGSMQIQGEAMELVIESWLSSQFPFDSISEVKKGVFGADCVQKVNTREIANCGVICYESKNTKNWSNDWIGKLKQDMLSIHADIGVLVTAVYPKDMKRMGFVEGIWVCSLNEFKGSSSFLRESLIRLEESTQKNENKADKMSLLYNYMTGNEFNMQMSAIVEGFMTMQQELDKEKRSLMASWKRREKTIDGVLQNTTEMYGALQGIAGSSAIVHIEALELLE